MSVFLLPVWQANRPPVAPNLVLRHGKGKGALAPLPEKPAKRLNFQEL
jgi:hypothetical protein